MPSRLPLLAACLVLLPRVAVTAGEDARPNILFVLTDDQSPRTVGGYREADPWARTPQIDRLAAMGVRFEQAYVGTWCMPARASLLTGRLPHAVESLRMTGNYPGAAYDPAQAPFWPRLLRAAGYVTAHIGKWHLGGDTGFGRDWDHQISWERPEQRHRTDNSGYYEQQRVSIDGSPPRLVDGYATDNYTRWACEFIAGRNRAPGRPWMLWLCYTAPHGPYVPAERHRGLYAGARVPVPVDVHPPRPGKPAYMQRVRSWTPDAEGRLRSAHVDGDTLDEGVRRYHQTVAAVDEGVGALLACLEASGQLRNTVIVFTSDQGFAWGEHGFSLKVAPYDANLRAPLVVAWPGRWPAGRVVRGAVSGVDLVPTLLRAARVEPAWPLHGRDLHPLIETETAAAERPVLLTYTGWTFGRATAAVPADGLDGHGRATGVPWYAMLRDGSWKYIRTLGADGAEELYNLARDPAELTNLAGEPAQAETLARLRRRAAEELVRTEAPFALPDS